MRSTELTVHAWDVARATGRPTDFLPELCARLAAIARADDATIGAKSGSNIADESPSGLNVDMLLSTSLPKFPVNRIGASCLALAFR